MRMKSYTKRLLAFVLSLIMVLGCMPQTAYAEPDESAQAETPTVVTDPGTADKWEEIMGTTADGTRYAGRVWVDKSVYKNGDVVTLNQKGNEESDFTVDVDEENGEYFQVVFSALGSSLTTNTTINSSSPLDVVLVLDTSTSMAFLVDDEDNNSQRMRYMIPAANTLLEQLLELGDVRVSIVTYNANSETVLPLAKYENGVELRVNNYLNNGNTGAGVIYAYDDSNQLLGNDSGYEQGTNLQSGIDMGMKILAEAEGTEGRTPVAIVLTDGEANRAVRTNWYDIVNGTQRNEYVMNEGIALSTLLNAAYNKARVEKNYDTDMQVYGVGVDLDTGSGAHAIMDPENSFNSQNGNDYIREAYEGFEEWRTGKTVVLETQGNFRTYTWTFDHDLPRNSGVTSEDVAANINYVDNYQNVSSASLGEAFDSIIEELSDPAFNPISDNKNGSTGVDGTPLIYADNIGQYMEVKNIQALQVFGNTYNITKNDDGTYSVATGSGKNPTTGEEWSTAKDISINVIENTDGTQQLRVYINQEILPILLDTVTVTTENGVTTRTFEEENYPPLRVYYTVGIDSDILLANGQVDPSKLDNDYAYINEEDGTVSFYSNAFGELNPAGTDGSVDRGDAHVGFVPSHENRFYYHQAHQEIFTSATNIDGTEIEWEDDMYGVRWDKTKYALEAMDYADLDNIEDTDKVYTYVTFTRPISDAANEAEEVTYLVYTTWGDLKSAATYYDKVNDVFLNEGAAIEPSQVGATVSEYKVANNVTDRDLIAVLGVQSRRVSRLSNMFETKSANTTDTAEIAYAPTYNDGAHEEGDIHENSEVIVWLGNNGKLTLPVASGIKVTKEVIEFAGEDNENVKFDIQVVLDMAYSDGNVALLSVTDTNGTELNKDTDYVISESSDNKIRVTLKLANGESAYILGTPDNTSFTVTEEYTKYEAVYTGASQTETGKIVEGVITNTAKHPGGLYITKEVVHANGGEVFPAEYEFEFKVTFKDAEGEPIANTTFQLDNNYEPNLKSLTTDEVGVMTGKLRHGEIVYIKDIPADATVTVEEIEIPDNYTSTVYRSRNYSGAEADNDGVVTITSGQNATVVVTNTYTPDPVSVTINFNGTKNFDASQMTSASEFTFKLQEYKNGKWTDVNSSSVRFNPSDAENCKEFNFKSLTLNDLTTPGTHSYQIVEVIGDNTDITYDRSVYTFSVNVTLDNDGDLKAEVEGHNELKDVFEVSKDSETGEYNVNTVFTNYYHKTATSIEIIKQIEDNANSGKTAAGFVVETYNATVVDGAWTIGEKIRETVTDAQGEALLVRNYDNTDFENDIDNDNKVTHYFIIKESNAGVTLGGWTYDSTEYRVTVVLTREDKNSPITADFNVVKVDAQGNETGLNVSGDTATISFNNTYNPSSATIDVNTLVKKELTGRNLVVGEFEFAIYKDGQAGQNGAGPIATGTNDAEGNVSFTPDKLTFTQVGKYAYDIVELAGTNAGVTYDSTIYDLVVEVKDNNGTLEASYYFEDSVDKIVTFKNDYTVQPTEVVIDGIKTLQVNSGKKTLKAGEYTFALYKGEEKIGETTNLADGIFKFDAIKYTSEDIGETHTYTVKEVIPEDAVNGVKNGVTWSTEVYTVTVEVSDTGNGTLSTEMIYKTGETVVDIIKFENTYDSAAASVTLSGTKTLQNRELKADEFTFALYNEAGDEIATTKNASDGTFKFGKITYGKDHVDMTFNYTVKEIIPDSPKKGIHYSNAVYNVTVKVTDDGKGQMTAETTIMSSGAEVDDIEFSNAYIPEPGTITVSGTKNYEGGKTLTDGVFSVGLYGKDDHGKDMLLDTANVKADGSFAFHELKYDAGDIGNTYVYTIKEIIDENDEKHIYDKTEYTLEVTVEDEMKDGVLEITQTLSQGNKNVDDLTFTNTYIPDPVAYTIKAKKIYDKGLKGGDFEFKLTDADGKTKVKQTKKNDKEGNIVFDEITFEAAGDYKFKLTEKKEGIFDFIRPSLAEYEITIEVVNNNGVLSIVDVATVNTKNTDESNLEFVNTYVLDGENEVVLRGTKILTGDRTQVKAGEFEFGLYDEEGKLVETVKNDAKGNFVFTALKFDETDVTINGQKEVTYTVKEIAGNDTSVTYDKTVYTVVITVEDNDQGGVAVSYTVDGKADRELTFTNIYTEKNTDTVPDDSDIVDTGDHSHMGMWFMLLCMSGVVVTMTARSRKRR